MTTTANRQGWLSLVLYDRPGDLANLLEKYGVKMDLVDLAAGEMVLRVITWRPPATPKLQQLLEQAAIIAAREDGKAGAHIKRALEACKGKAPKLSSYTMGESVVDQDELTAREAVAQDKTRDP